MPWNLAQIRHDIQKINFRQKNQKNVPLVWRNAEPPSSSSSSAADCRHQHPFGSLAPCSVHQGGARSCDLNPKVPYQCLALTCHHLVEAEMVGFRKLTLVHSVPKRALRPHENSTGIPTPYMKLDGALLVILAASAQCRKHQPSIKMW